MSRDEADPFLKFGQGILIEGFKTDDFQGLLTAKGFADPQAKYETYSDILYFKNYRNAIFQILPSSNFQINDELRKAKQTGEIEEANLRIMQARAASQKVQFELSIKGKDKNKVCFGATVIFKHIDSETYLSGTIRPSNGSNGAFTVEVTENMSQAMVFRLLPYRSYEFEGMPIPFDCPIKIKNEFNNGYLTFERLNMDSGKEEKSNLFEKKPIQGDDSYKIPVKTNSSASKIYETVTYFVDLSEEKEVPMPWKCKLHMNDVDNDILIQHDIVFLQHTENNGVLTASKGKIILKEQKGETSTELCFYECLWQIQKYYDGAEDQYILRHLMSGMTLGIERKEDSEDPKFPKLVDISEGPDAEDGLGVVELKPAKKEGGEINSGSFVNVCWGEYCLDLKKEEENEFQYREAEVEEGVKDTRIDKARMKELAASQIEYIEKDLEFTLDISKHCFKIMEIDDDLKKDLLFALSFHSKIIELREDLRFGASEAVKKITYLRMMRVTEKIREIKDFLKNCTGEEADLDHKHPIKKRQMICKDLGISELLFELLYYMKKNEDEKIFDQRVNESEKFYELYNTCYEVIVELIKNNYLFKVHVSKWILFVIDDVIRSDEPSRLNALKEILKDNTFFVDNLVTKDLIRNLTANMKDPSANMKDSEKKEKNSDFIEIKYIEIFRSFCIVGGKVNTNNQILILDHFVKELINDKNFAINIKKDKEGIRFEATVDKNKQKSRPFKDYYKICIEEYESAWAYCVAFLNLMADMVQGRNKTVETYIQTSFGIDIITELLEQEDLKEAEVPFIRLLHYLHIESENFYPVERHQRIIDYNTIDTQEIKMTATMSENKPWNPPLDKVMKVMLDKLAKYETIKPEEQKSNECLYEVLNFISETLGLGFFEKKQDLTVILVHILKILAPPEIRIEGAEDVNEVELAVLTLAQYEKYYERCKLKSKKNNLMVKCKLECMKIIQYILDYDEDLAVKNICRGFKNFELPVKKAHIIPKIENPDYSFSLDFIKQCSEVMSETILETSNCHQMVELSKYGNPELTSQSLSVMRRILTSKKLQINQFTDTIFVCEQQRIELVKFIEDRRNKFFLLEDPNMINVSTDNQNSNYFMVNKEDAETGIMQDLYIISELMKSENDIKDVRRMKTLSTSKMYGDLATDRLINFTDERKSSNEMKQQVVNASNIHKKALTYILNCKEFPKTDLAIKLLHLCYKFLVCLIENFQDIKLELIPLLGQMRHHIERNLGCIDFMKEIYDNNKNMLYNEVDIVQVIKEICAIINGLDTETSFYKSKLLDFFRYLIFCNEKALEFNQIQILKIMQDDTFQNIFITVTPEDIRNLVAEYETMNKPLEKDKVNLFIKRSSRMVYTETFYQMMGSLIDDNNKVNMGKLVKRFPFDFLVRSVEESYKCWTLKRNIRAFLNRLYYFQPDIVDFIKTIVKNQLANIITDLNYFIEIKSKQNAADFENQIFQNPVRFSYLESYLYLNLEENLLTLYTLVTNKKLQEEIKNYLHSSSEKGFDDHFNFIRICERLGWIKSYFNGKKNIYTGSLLKFLMAKFKSIINEFDDLVYSQGMAMLSGKPQRTKQEKESARVTLINKIMLGDIGMFYVQQSGEYNKPLPLVYQVPDRFTPPAEEKEPDREKLKKILMKILKREKRDFENKDEEVSYKLEKLISAIKLEPSVSEYFLQNYRSKLSSINEGGQDTMFSYIRVIIEMNSEDPTALSPELKIFFLQLISGLIEQANKFQFPEFTPLDCWSSDQMLPDTKGQIQKIQTELKKCQLSLLLSDLMKENIVDNIPLANAILLCSISFLITGNTITQNNLLEILNTDEENKVMTNLDALITKLGGLIRKNISEASGGVDVEEGIFSVSTIDNYDYYYETTKYCTRKNVFEPNSTNEKLYCDECITTYRRAFKFLQLLCQNNNVDGKNFIREQPKSKVRKSNFINIATKELRNLFTDFCHDIQEIPMFLIEFILEVTQMPVRTNQEVLMNLTFFEDLCTLQKTYRDDKKLMERNLENRDFLEEIYFKSVEIMLSNFEGNEKNIFMLLDSKIDPMFLTNILFDKLESLKITTKQEMMVYIESTTGTDDNGNIKLDDNVGQILNIIIIFMQVRDKLEDKSRIYSSYQTQKIKNNPQLFDYLENCLLSIEITNDKGVNQVVYFPKIPVFNSLSEGLKDYVMDKVERTTHRDKIVYLLGYTEDIKSCINYSYRLKKEENISEDNLKSSYKIAAMMSVVVCIFMMVFTDVIIEYGTAQFVSGRLIGLARFSLSLIQLSMSFVYFYYWYRLKIWYKPQKKQRGESNEGPKQEEAKEPAPEDVPAVQENPSFFRKITRTIIGVFRVIIVFIQGLMAGGDESEEEEQKFYKNAEFYRLSMFVGVAFLGTFVHPPLFFIHLIDIFCNFPMLSNIFEAIAYSIKSLFYVCLMGVAFTLIFCTVTFSNYMKNVYSGEESVDEMCDSMFSCVMKLYVSGAIGESMEVFEITRFVYDMIYATFFGMLFGNIVSGIMLDAFGSLRERSEELSNDKSNNCYICNIPREKVEKNGEDFKEHIKKHYLWNYVFYIYSLELKDETDYLGLEYSITSKYNRSDEEMDVSWIPMGDEEEFDSAAKVDQLMKKINETNESVNNTMEELESRIQEFNKAAEDYLGEE